MRSQVLFWLRRVGAALVTIVLALTIAFVLSRAVGGDPVRQLLGPDASAEQVAQRQAELGLDRPVIVQYVDYVGGIFRLDLGQSIRYGESNLMLILDRLPASLLLAGAALLIGVPIGLLLGMVSAVRRDGGTDKAVSAVALLGQSFPAFFVGLLLIRFFAVDLGWLPSGGSGSVAHLVLPAIALALLPLAQVSRVTRSSAIEVLEQDYVRAARARGFGTMVIVRDQVLRAIGLPVITLLGLQAGFLLSSAVTVEFVFNWPGLGSLTASAIQNRDFTLIQALVAFGALVFVVVNLIVDILYRFIDPRVRAA